MNAVVLVADKHRGRWLRATPDTFRVGVRPPSALKLEYDLLESDTGSKSVVANGERDELIGLAIGALATEQSDVAVVGEVTRPRRVGAGHFEPQVRSTKAFAIRRDTLELLRGCGFEGRPSELVRGAVYAGVQLALVPYDRGRIAAARVLIPPVVVVVSAVPMHDIGGGSRAAQLTLALLDAGTTVVYVSVFPSYETVDLGLRFVHPALEQLRLADVDVKVILAQVESPGWIVVEVPDLGAIRLANLLRDNGWLVCYDIIDRWSDPALGADWYSAPAEENLIRSADLVVASAPDLVEIAEGFGVEGVHIPNAVNAEVFGSEPGPLPEDFPEGVGPVLGYHGSFYGEWLDWGAIDETAKRFPTARLVMIGDHSRGVPELPTNVHFLGLKPLGELPAYVSRFDVGLLPFVVSETTHAVSPLKVYEYLASGVPVAAPPLRSLDGLEGVHCSEVLSDAVTEALASERPDPAVVLTQHSWTNRAKSLLSSMGVKGRPDGFPARILVRQVTHYQSDERELG